MRHEEQQVSNDHPEAVRSAPVPVPSAGGRTEVPEDALDDRGTFDDPSVAGDDRTRRTGDDDRSPRAGGDGATDDDTRVTRTAQRDADEGASTTPHRCRPRSAPPPWPAPWPRPPWPARVPRTRWTPARSGRPARATARRRASARACGPTRRPNCTVAAARSPRRPPSPAGSGRRNRPGPVSCHPPSTATRDGGPMPPTPTPPRTAARRPGWSTPTRTRPPAGASGTVAAAAGAPGSLASAGTARPAGSTVAAEPASLFDARTAQTFRDRWRDVQLRFVDDPRAAAGEAEALVEEAIEALSAALAAQKDTLGGWQEAGSADTEELRMAVRRYRDFLDRVLGR